jgi:nitroreductase
MKFDEIIEKRYSVRSYSTKKVEDEKIEAILQAVKHAPTAKNCQPQKIYVIKSETELEKLRAIVSNNFGAPVVMIICGDMEKACILKSNGRNFIETDCSIIQTYMMLKATELGLGTCWIGRFMPEEIKQTFNLSDSEVPFGILLVGYTVDDCEPSPRHFERIDTSDFVKYL